MTINRNLSDELSTKISLILIEQIAFDDSGALREREFPRSSHHLQKEV